RPGGFGADEAAAMEDRGAAVWGAGGGVGRELKNGPEQPAAKDAKDSRRAQKENSNFDFLNLSRLSRDLGVLRGRLSVFSPAYQKPGKSSSRARRAFHPGRTTGPRRWRAGGRNG